MLHTDNIVWNKVVDVVSKSHLFKEGIKVSTLETTSHSQSSVNVKKLRNRLQKIETELENISNTIVTLETDKLIKSRNTDEVSRILENVEQHKINLEGEREEITDTLLKEREDQKWVSWVKEFGDRIDELNSPEFDVSKKKKFLEGIVEKIVVTNTDIQTHELVIHFKFPYVGDKIIWKNKQKKSDGYKIRRGRKSTKVVYDLLKK